MPPFNPHIILTKVPLSEIYLYNALYEVLTENIKTINKYVKTEEDYQYNYMPLSTLYKPDNASTPHINELNDIMHDVHKYVYYFKDTIIKKVLQKENDGLYRFV